MRGLYSDICFSIDSIIFLASIDKTSKQTTLDFFLLDNRYHKTSNKNFTTQRQLLGKEQIDWLINALSSSLAPFKFVAVGGQVLSSEAQHENYATFPEEREYLLRKIREAKIEGVIFLDGDSCGNLKIKCILKSHG